METMTLEMASQNAKEAAEAYRVASERVCRARDELDSALVALDDHRTVLRRANKALVMAAGGAVSEGL